MVSADKLKAAGVIASEKPGLLIEDFQGVWEKEWFVKGQKSRKTFKLKSPQYKAPPGSKLSLEIQSDKTGHMMLGMEKEKDRYHHPVSFKSGWTALLIYISLN